MNTVTYIRNNGTSVKHNDLANEDISKIKAVYLNGTVSIPPLFVGLDKVITLRLNTAEQVDEFIYGEYASYTNLEHLHLLGIGNINLPYISSLRILYVRYNRDFTMAKEYKKLEKLVIAHSKLSDCNLDNLVVDHLKLLTCWGVPNGLIKAKKVTIDSDRSDIAIYSALEAMGVEHLAVYDEDDRFTKHIRNLRLKSLSLHYVPVDTSLILNNEQLEKVSIRNSDMEEFDNDTIKSFKNIKILHLDNTCFTSTTCLKEFTSLRTLKADISRIKDLSGLEGLNIEVLDISGAPTCDLSALATLKNLKVLDASCIGISDTDFLCGLDNLTDLNLSHNMITNVTNVARCYNLERLDLSHNIIYDSEPLKALKNLKTMNISNNYLVSRDNLADEGYIAELIARKSKIVTNMANIDDSSTRECFTEVYEKIKKLPVAEGMPQRYRSIVKCGRTDRCSDILSTILSRMWSLIEEHESSETICSLIENDSNDTCSTAITCSTVCVIALFFDEYALREPRELTMIDIVIEAARGNYEDKIAYIEQEMMKRLNY